VFQAALERDPGQRSAYLAEACAGDESLRGEVESLISSHEQASNFIESPVYEVAAPLFADQRVKLPVGESIGPYRVVSLVGAGGMGEVYRARDSRLARDVALKVIPSAYSGDSDRLRRFEQEARAAGQLNHPNILAIYDTGTHDGVPYVVSELLEGETLRERIKGAALSQRKAVDYALQIAHGLAAAHDKGIVHRDLKPENLFITKDGRVKILDFGLAKLTQPQFGAETEAPTIPAQSDTGSGVILGTVGYMSPEQVRGERVDHRSDLFSFGAILYEMLTGKRAFHGSSAVETMNAILKDDPPELTKTNQSISPGIERVVQHCLEKSAEQRFQSARDIAFAIEALSGISTTGVSAVAVTQQRASRRWLPAAVAVALVAVFAGGLLAGKPIWKTPIPSFHQLTFRPGLVWSARFAPDGQTIIYSGLWEGKPSELFTTRAESPESRPLGLADTAILAISSSGEMAVSLKPTINFNIVGTLARLPLAGGAPREVLNGVQEADWTPNGKDLAVVHWEGAMCRLEFPIGKVLYEAGPPGWISHVRISPRGDLIAFLIHPTQRFDTRGFVEIVDLAGNKKAASKTSAGLTGAAWSPTGDELWYTAMDDDLNIALYAITPSGRERMIARPAGLMTLHDISRDGRLLLTRENPRTGIIALPPGETKERDLSWFDGSWVRDISADGKTVLYEESGIGGGVTGRVELRNTDGSPAIQLGEGIGIALSPDGKWALARQRHTTPPQLILYPTGVGTPRPLPSEPITYAETGRWFPDSKRILLTGTEPDHRARSYIYDIDSGESRPLTPEGITGRLISPDGKSFIGGGGQQKRAMFSVEGGNNPRPIPGLENQDFPLGWSADGRSLYVAQGRLPVKVYRLDLASGQREFLKELMPSNPAGLLFMTPPHLTPDGKSYAYTYYRVLSDLYLVEGMK
jgi:serine/threonine protein kinase/Tol biopolymer transport system component